jgi:hypothetical protein
MKLNFKGGAMLPRGLDFWRRGRAAPPLLAATILLFAVGATAETTNDLSDAEIQGRQLAQKILEQQPAENFTNTGVLQIRDGHGNQTNLSIQCEVVVTPDHWQNIYKVIETNMSAGYDPTLVLEKLSITHPAGRPNEYELETSRDPAIDLPEHSDKSGKEPQREIAAHIASTIAKPSGFETMRSFAGSDFWAADLGLEFFHWPQQKILKQDVHRSRGCMVLESTNPNPFNGYSRVVSWIDEESLGIVEANAYDVKGKLLKDFYPKDFKKVNGQWQVQMLVMENVQTRSRSRLEFDLNKQ